VRPDKVNDDGDGQGVNPDALPAPGYVHLLRVLTATLLFAMMALGFVDVVLRYIFNSPIHGAFPIMGFLLGLVVFTSLPLITRDGRHITVDLFERHYSGRLGAATEWFSLLLSIAVTAFITERMWSFSLRRKQMGQLHDMIDVQLWPFAMVFSVFAGLTCLILVGQFVGRFRSMISRSTGNPGSGKGPA